MKKSSISNRILIIFSIILILAMGVTVTFNYFVVQGLIKDQIISIERKQVEKIGTNTINSLISEKKGQIKVLTHTLPLFNDVKKLQEYFTTQVESSDDVYSIYAGFSSGMSYAYDRSNIGTDFKSYDRPWYKQAILHKGSVVISSPYLDVYSNKLVVTVAYYSGQLQGFGDPNIDGQECVIGIDIDANIIKQEIEKYSSASNARIFITDENYSVIYGDSNNVIEENSPFKNLYDIPKFKTALREINNGVVYPIIKDKNNEDTYLIKSKIPNTNWTLFAVVPSRFIVSGVLIRIIPNIIIFLLTILASLFILDLTLKRNMVKPLKKLALEGQKIASGNFVADLVYNENDEIGEVYKSFYSLGKKVRKLSLDIKNMAKVHSTNGVMEFKLTPDEYEGDFKEIVKDVNTITNTYTEILFDVNDTLQHFLNGNFYINIYHLPGSQGNISENVNNLKNYLLNVNREINNIALHAKDGRLSERTDVQKYKGEWKKIFTRLNQVMDYITRPLGEVSKALKKLSQGQLNTRIEGSYNGDFDKIVTEINNSIHDTANFLLDVSNTLTEMNNNNFNVYIMKEYAGDFHFIKTSINNVLDKNNLSFKKLKVGTYRINYCVGEIINSGNSITNGIFNEKNIIIEMDNSIGKITKISKNANAKVNRTNLIAKNTEKIVDDGNVNMQELVKSMTFIDDSSEEIRNIISIMQSIAFETNLVAINASIEASRAGEFGKGFNVIAEQVRALANRSQKSSKDMNKIIKKSIALVHAGTKTATDTAKTFKQIKYGVYTVNKTITDLVDSSHETTIAVADIQFGLKGVTKIIKDTEYHLEKNTKSLDELIEFSERLKTHVNNSNLHEDDN